MEEEYTQNINPSALAPRRNKFNIWIGQLAKLIFERPQGSLPSNIESNPREKLNVITIQDKEGLVEPELELRQGIVVSKGKGEVVHSEQKSVSKEYKPRVPYPNATRKDRTDEQFEIRSKSMHEPCSNNNKGPIHEERRLQFEELDEWRTQKLRAHDRPKPRHNELNVSPNQLKVGDKVLLDAVDPRITTFEPNGAILIMVLSIFPYGTVEVINPKFGTFKVAQIHMARHTGVPSAVPIPREATRPCDMAV
ncbi:hypothetical protein GOBAR_AA13801 [Gossypium barbadense]|uniref:Uncharacterized protein n=1 Tax=Gossypium barbadense TaxID=3634 RepID=A0A2P5XU98_GOSBA|nr:hypothetical protein GOBAR_AA13801 [Gossypium barbadense]